MKFKSGSKHRHLRLAGALLLILVLLIFIQIVAFLSDRLFLVLFTGPAFLTFALRWKNRQSLVLAISQICVALIGFVLFNNLKGFFNLHHELSNTSKLGRCVGRKSFRGVVSPRLE